MPLFFALAIAVDISEPIAVSSQNASAFFSADQSRKTAQLTIAPRATPSIRAVIAAIFATLCHFVELKTSVSRWRNVMSLRAG